MRTCQMCGGRITSSSPRTTEVEGKILFFHVPCFERGRADRRVGGDQRAVRAPGWFKGGSS